MLFEYFSKNLSRKFKLHHNLRKITVTLHEDQCTCIIVYPSVLLRMRNALDKICGENQKNTLCSVAFSEHRAVYEMMWENTVEIDR